MINVRIKTLSWTHDCHADDIVLVQPLMCNLTGKVLLCTIHAGSISTRKLHLKFMILFAATNADGSSSSCLIRYVDAVQDLGCW